MKPVIITYQLKSKTSETPQPKQKKQKKHTTNTEQEQQTTSRGGPTVGFENSPPGGSPHPSIPSDKYKSMYPSPGWTNSPDEPMEASCISLCIYIYKYKYDIICNHV